MKKRETDRIIHSFFQQLKKYCRQIKKESTIESIHYFRVEVKKLRAFLRMLFFDSPHPEKGKIPRRLKEMYSTLGKIRDRQLLSARLEKSFPGFKTGDAGTKKMGNKYPKVNILSPKTLLDIERKIKKKTSAKPGRNTVKDFLRGKSVNIESILKNKKYTDKNLHAIRKELKDAIYTTKLFKKKSLDLPETIFWSGNDLKKAETIANNLGLFNDACNTLSYLSSPALKKATAKNLQGLRQAQKKWADEKKILKEQFRKNIPVMKKLCVLPK